MPTCEGGGRLSTQRDSGGREDRGGVTRLPEVPSPHPPRRSGLPSGFIMATSSGECVPFPRPHCSTAAANDRWSCRRLLLVVRLAMCVNGRGAVAVASRSAGVSRAGAALAALFADGKTPWQRTLFILLVLVAGLAFAILLAAGLQGVGSLWRARRTTKGSEVPARRPSLEVSRFGFIEGFVPPLEPVCDRIRQAVARANAGPGSLYSPAIADMARPGLRGGRAERCRRTSHTIVVVEFRDDWPKDVRGERAFEEFRLQIHQASTSSEGVEFDELLAAGATLLILDDVRTESDLGPFFPFFDKCTVLVTALDSRISTALKAGRTALYAF